MRLELPGNDYDNNDDNKLGKDWDTAVGGWPLIRYSDGVDWIYEEPEGFPPTPPVFLFHSEDSKEERRKRNDET